ncbi:MAG: phytoene/squalene synthase family protein [Myxococcaceae bacterium]
MSVNVLHTAQTGSDATFCRQILPEVSRTFALNIPALPPPLDLAVTIAYLLCRIADTVEDEARGAASERKALLAELSRLTALPKDVWTACERFELEATASLRREAPPAEVALVRGTSNVVRALAALPIPTHAPIARCVSDMTRGMGEVVERNQRSGKLGLANLEETLDYCYYVAGTVGEMLTALFLWHAPELYDSREEVESRAVAFGRALQLTNILKDIREDLDRGDCWLPRDVLKRHGLTPETLIDPDKRQQAVNALNELLGVAHGEAVHAFEYTRALPREEKGMRLFCLWPLFMAVLTLKKLHNNPAVFEQAPVKIERGAVGSVVALTTAVVKHNRALTFLFKSLTEGLPQPRREGQASTAFASTNSSESASRSPAAMPIKSKSAITTEGGNPCYQPVAAPPPLERYSRPTSKTWR